ncbi:MAG: hypothetical protein O6949_13340, partial [Chloroflexi bacterium]|nr:hypothetical protein [Chloroflexota bacterium]
MARTVFIFGAGASSHSGAPLMSEFYRKVVDIQEEGSLERYQPDFDIVVRASGQLDNVYAKMDMGYHQNIEELFATFEMAKLLHRLGNLSDEDLEVLPTAMRAVIAATIEESMKYIYYRGEGLKAPVGYLSFVGMLKSLLSDFPS